MRNRRCKVQAIGLYLLMALVVGAGVAQGAEPRMTMWGTPPRQKPHFTKGAEGFPPLPLPVTPQRRTEKKRPPAPPLLIANLSRFSFDGWLGSPGAVDQLLQNARRNLNLWYGWEQLDIQTVVREFNSNLQHKTPILYLCALYPLNLTQDQRQALAAYVLNGGTLLINCCGQDAAFQSAREELARMFPHYELRRLPPDHPLYTANYRITAVHYLAPAPGIAPGNTHAGETVGLPRLEAVTIGTRAAVIVSREDLACGWNQWNNPAVARVTPEDSTKLGLNIMTYVTAEMRFAKFLSHTQEVAGPTIRPREQLVLAQLVHNGNWDPNPSAVPLFLKDLASNTSIAVSFDRKVLELKDPTIFSYPLLYLTGTWDPRFSKEEVAILRRYLTTGGTLIADAAAGRVEFDIAFRKLCRTMFPDAPLKVLPPGHPIYTCFYHMTSAHVNLEKGPVQPQIEAVMINGRAAILYSKLGLSDGWAQVFSVYARSYDSADAIKLGTNMVVYAMQ